MGYRSDSIAVSRDMGPLRQATHLKATHPNIRGSLVGVGNGWGCGVAFFQALHSQVSEPDIWQRSLFLCTISGIFLEISASEKYFSNSGKLPFYTPPIQPPLSADRNIKQFQRTVCANSFCLFCAYFKGKGGAICRNCSNIVCTNCAFVWLGVFWGASPLHECCKLSHLKGDWVFLRSMKLSTPWHDTNT